IFGYCPEQRTKGLWFDYGSAVLNGRGGKSSFEPPRWIVLCTACRDGIAKDLAHNGPHTSRGLMPPARLRLAKGHQNVRRFEFSDGPRADLGARHAEQPFNLRDRRLSASFLALFGDQFLGDCVESIGGRDR